MDANNIKVKIDQVINKCINDEEIYLNIITDFFTQGINKNSASLVSLQILPYIKDKYLPDNFKKNIKKIVNSIKNEIKPNLLIYRVLSCIYGAFYGDALGAFCEFSKYSKDNHKKIFKVTPYFGGEKGQVTDDSEMAMSFAYAIMDTPSKEILDSNYLYFYYGAWSKSNPRDIGHSTKKALAKFNFNQFLPKRDGFKNIEAEIYQNNYKALSNGFLMRKSTFIIWLYYRFYGEINKALKEDKNSQPLFDLYIKIKELSHVDNRCTHPNPETDIISSFYCIMGLGVLFLNEMRPNYILDKLENLWKNELLKKGNEIEKNISKYFISCLNTFNDKKFDFYKYFGDINSPNCVSKKDMGYYLHAFLLTIYYLLNYDKYEKKTGYTDIMDQICDLGGDTDTNCCIVGGIIGPIFGMSNFGSNFYSSLDLIPQKRYIYSIALMVPYIMYLKKSNEHSSLIKNDRYFLKTILTLLYYDFEVNLA
jgi:ADP-ribosylglycohydrolase